MDLIGCPETSLTTNLRCVKSQKREDFIDTGEEASNNTYINSARNIVKQMQEWFKCAVHRHATSTVCTNMPTFIPRPSFV